MPKIREVEFKIDGKFIKYAMYYNSGEGFHLKNFPDSVVEVANIEYKKYCNTEAQLMDYYTNVVRNYHENSSKFTKVILYTLALPTGKRMNKVGHGSYQGVNPMVPEKIGNKIMDIRVGDYGSDFDEEFGFIIGYRVVFRLDKNGVKHHRVKEDGTPGREASQIKRAEIEIEWSPEREAFL